MEVNDDREASGGLGGERGRSDALLDVWDLGVFGVAANRPLGRVIPEWLVFKNEWSKR